ncbi:hypothetical protein Acr_04g0001180 [Actinidia rufa]|uniref:Uncharacterized protein n=1 Tax=Actinidia rufa TaxID=165716 RepID=A0A7J0EG68_9ERIC|nr:hypothetical protein Acr_04g0001180 [Actinidia rufa]
MWELWRDGAIMPEEGSSEVELLNPVDCSLVAARGLNKELQYFEEVWQQKVYTEEEAFITLKAPNQDKAPSLNEMILDNFSTILGSG